jgi:hypothetical protein
MSRHRVLFIFHLNKIAHTSATDTKGLLPFDGEVPVSLAKMTDSTKMKPNESSRHGRFGNVAALLSHSIDLAR